MRRTLLASLLITLAAAGASAAPLWYDVITNYNGCITTNPGTPWFAHLPGSLTATDALIVTNTYTSGAASNGKRLSVNGLNSQYVMRLFDPATTNVYYSGVVYASFIANASFVPAAGAGTYFAAFDNADTNNPPQNYTNGFDFRGRVSEIGVPSVYPFTTRVSNTKVFQWGIANAAADAPAGLPNTLFPPIDAVANVDYQIVVKYDIDAATATLWVNPASESDTANMAGPTSDFGAAANGLAGFLFRQRTTGGTVGVRDVAVGLSFADVMTNTAATSPVLVANNFNTVTNYEGNPGLLEVFATSIGGGALSYQWYQVSGGVTNPVGGNSQTYVVASLAGPDTGSYFCAVTNSGGQGALSVNSFYISVNATPTPPFFTFKSPTPVNGSVGGKLILTNTASGTGPLTYQWSFNGNPLTDGAPATGNAGDNSVVSGSQTPVLTVSALSTNETGSFSVLVTSTATGLAYNTTNAAVAVTVNPARAVSIAFIRSLENTNTGDTTLWQVTDTGSIFTISNAVVTMFTNVTSGTTASYYIQDATGGLDMFVTGDATFRPQMGDLVSISGTLSSFSNAIELMVDTSNPYQFYGITGHTNVLPAPVVVPLSVTNDAANMETNLEGRIVMLTNVGFNGSLTTASGNGSLFVTNAQGIFQIFFPGGTDVDVKGKTLQARFAWTITGVMAQFKSGTWNNSTYEVYVTRIGDIMTNPPPAVTATETRFGNDMVLNWTAVPYTPDTRGAYAYSVLAATDVAGPYLPLATGLAFNTTNATYTDVNGLLGARKFYRISSP